MYVYLTSGMDGVGEAKDRVSCDFTKDSFDLKIHDFGGKNYRLVKTNLDKEIIPSESKVVVKKNSIKITLRKVGAAWALLPAAAAHAVARKVPQACPRQQLPRAGQR